jgi:hypothetical protein
MFLSTRSRGVRRLSLVCSVSCGLLLCRGCFIEKNAAGGPYIDAATIGVRFVAYLLVGVRYGSSPGFSMDLIGRPSKPDDSPDRV